MPEINPRFLSPLALLAIVPAAAFLLGRESIGWLAAGCVLLIVGSLSHVFGPAGAEPGTAT